MQIDTTAVSGTWHPVAGMTSKTNRETTLLPHRMG